MHKTRLRRRSGRAERLRQSRPAAQRRERLRVGPAVGFLRLGLLVRGVARLLRPLDRPPRVTPAAQSRYSSTLPGQGAGFLSRKLLDQLVAHPSRKLHPDKPPHEAVRGAAQAKDEPEPLLGRLRISTSGTWRRSSTRSWKPSRPHWRGVTGW